MPVTSSLDSAPGFTAGVEWAAHALQRQADYLGFIALALAALFVVCLRIRRVAGRRLPRTAHLLFALVLVVGWPLIDLIGNRPEQNIRRILANVAPTAAMLMAEAGHELIGPETPVDDLRFRKLLQLQQSFLSATPNFVAIYTLRPMADGRGLCLLSSRKAGSEPLAESTLAGKRASLRGFALPLSPAMSAVLRGESAHYAEMSETRGQRLVTAMAPIRRSDGSIDGAVGVDFDAGLWIKARRLYRGAGIALAAVVLSLIVVSASSVATLRTQLDVVQAAETRSREAESHLRQIVETSEDAVILTDERGLITRWNRRAVELFRWSSPGPIGQPVGPAIAPGPDFTPFAGGLMQLLPTLPAGGGHERLELRLPSRDGQELIAELSASAILLGDLRHYVLYVRDITARRRSEADIRKLNRRLESSQHFGHLGTWEFDARAETVTTSSIALLILGLQENSPTLTLDRLFGLVHPDDLASHRPDLVLAAGKGSDYSAEFRIIRPDGTVRHVQLRGQPIRDELGRAAGLTGTILDVTELAQANTALRVGQRQFRTIFESAASGLIVTDSNRLVTLANIRAAEILRSTREAIAGRQIDELVQSAGLSSTHGGRISDLAGGKPVRLRRKDPSRPAFYGEMHVREIETLSGRGFVVQIDDITDREATLQADLRAQRMESIGTLSAGIAHDLNNAIAPICLGTEMLRQRIPAQSDLLNVMEKSATRTVNMIKQLLSFARGTQGERRPITSRALIEDMAEIVRRTFPKDIELQLQIRPSRSILGDPTQLHQVLLNLCVNARDAMPDGGSLRIGAADCVLEAATAALPEAAPPGTYVKWSVQDTGTGIPPGILERIFDPFFTTKEPGKGTGLGLSTVLGIVRGHGGYLIVSSQPGAGSTFEVLLPANVTRENDATELALAPRSKFRGRGEMILVVDDEELIREVTRAALLDLNFRVLVAANGAEALHLLQLHGPEIAAAITDIQMPGMDGIRFTAAARSALPLNRIIMMSGYTTEEVANDLRSSGVAAILKKPVSHARLIEVLARVLGYEFAHSHANTVEA